MLCPRCNGELRRSIKNPEFCLCDNCMKKYQWINAEEDYEMDFGLNQKTAENVFMHGNMQNDATKNLLSTSVAYSVEMEISALVKRMSIFLADRDFKRVIFYSEKVLDIDPENGNAYVFRLLAETKVTSISELKDRTEALDRYPSYVKALKYTDEQTRQCISEINEQTKRNENKKRKNRNNTIKFVAFTMVLVSIVMIVFEIVFGAISRQHYISVESMQDKICGEWQVWKEYYLHGDEWNEKKILDSRHGVFIEKNKMKGLFDPYITSWNPLYGTIEFRFNSANGQIIVLKGGKMLIYTYTYPEGDRLIRFLYRKN